MPQLFQSTSSVWRTTATRCRAVGTSRISIHVLRVEDDERLERIAYKGKYFNPRPPCGGRLHNQADAARKGLISIHVLRVEDDPGKNKRNGIPAHFNPRPPCGGRRRISKFRFPQPLISIHVLRVEDDYWRAKYDAAETISIHVLRVEDDCGCNGVQCDKCYFNPRPPCGGRRAHLALWNAAAVISIHVLRVEDDLR